MSFCREDDAPPPRKKRATRSTAAEKAAKKTARMERNRIAAQVSRDRKKEHAHHLELRVAELEAELASRTPAAAVFPSPALTLLSLPTPPSSASTELVVGQLKEENESLKTQLALEKIASQSLQIRLSSLEAKFGRLEQLFGRGVPTRSTGVEVLSPRSTRGRPVPAAEAVPPVFDHSLPPSSSSVPSLDFSLDFDFSPPFDLGDFSSSTSSNLDLDLDLAAPHSLDHPDLSRAPGVVDPPVVPQDDLVQAWSDWAAHLDESAFEQQQPPFEPLFEPAQGEEVNFFDFLQQETAAGSAVQAVC
ncbi:hypothetical protein JCM6882_005684 [Rhodosporidiobolus microsporus]